MVYRGLRYFLRKLMEKRRSFNWTKPKSLYFDDYKKLKHIKDKHKGQPCVLIGGGPSINKLDLNKLDNTVTIACNGFYLKHPELDFLPTYYTVEDPLPAEDNKHEISSLKNTTKIIPTDLEKFISRDENTIYCNFQRSYLRPSRKDYPLFSEDFSKESYWGGTVMYFNIQLAYHLGCNPIYLIGVDLSYNVPDSAKRSGAVLTSTEDDNNHFDPRYFGQGKRWHLPETDRMQHCFTKAYKELDKRGVKLINIGVDSNLKDIPKEYYHKIFK
nr:hypothetical protein BCU82_13145 [Vibrio cyclitrophicus]